MLVVRSRQPKHCGSCTNLFSMLFFRESETEYLDHPSKAMDSAQKDSSKNEREGLQNRSMSTTDCIVIISILKVTHAH